METEKKEVQETTVPHESSAPEQQSSEVSANLPKERTAKSGNHMRLVVAAAVLVLFIVGIAYYSTQDKNASNDVVALSAIDPTTVRAVVNGEEITQGVIVDRLSEAQGALIAQGVDLNNPDTRAQVEAQILSDTINYTLLKQAAAEAGTSVSDEEVETLYNQYITQMGSEEALATQLQSISLTLEAFKQRIREQLLLDAFISENVDFSGIEVTDEEISAFYENAVESLGEAAPPLDEVRTQIEEQLRTQKRQELTQIFIDSLREKADITIN